MLQHLLQEWYKIVSADHHKTRDCYFEITRTFCTYETEYKWTVVHNGYITEFYSPEFSTYDEAEKYLIEKLKVMIEYYKNSTDEVS